MEKQHTPMTATALGFGRARGLREGRKIQLFLLVGGGTRCRAATCP
uniref:Uncharacterized protein n=1 Tax=Arundo donax TaxID=35708 RepID=A0A0A9ANK4_ARUDO